MYEVLALNNYQWLICHKIKPNQTKLSNFFSCHRMYVCRISSEKPLEFSPMAQEIGVQSQVESYQRLLKWYLIPHCLTLSIIRYVSRVKWNNLGNRSSALPNNLVLSLLKRELSSGP